MQQVITVTAGIIIKEGLVFCARRSTGRSQAGLWEFPGGKVEAGEAKVDALERELFEELSVNVTVKSIFNDNVYQYPELSIHLWSYFVEPHTEVVLGSDHDDLKWLPVSELSTLAWSPADYPVVEKLQQQGLVAI